MKTTAIAPSNIAFIKYWGKKDEKLRLPANGSISVNLSNLKTTTTVEFMKELKKDAVIINDKKDRKQEERVIKHLDRIRKISNLKYKAKVVSKNSFPTGAGLASSASAFAALTLAASKSAGLKLSEKELSIIARQGSGSACRSIPDGFVEWLDGSINENSYAVSLYPPDYWKIVMVVVITDYEEKEIGSTEGQIRALSNPFLKVRLAKIKNKMHELKKILKEKDFQKFGELTEKEALELHAIALTSNPPIIYWKPKTIKVMKLVQELRRKYFPVYFTIDSGPHVCILCEQINLRKLIEYLRANKINEFIVNRPTAGARIAESHLF